MKTFKDLQFKPYSCLPGMPGEHAILMFKNEYGVSVIRGPYTYGGKQGLYELAVLDKDGNLTYDTPITDDVIGHLTADGVTKTMIEVQKL